MITGLMILVGGSALISATICALNVYEAKTRKQDNAELFSEWLAMREEQRRNAKRKQHWDDEFTKWGRETC